jgi:site-specific DNA-methyltransferase (adenine-specific)
MQIYRSLDEVVEAGTIAPNSIVNADCLEAMKLIADKSVDAIVCDLPYGVTNCHWDSVIPFDLLWEQYKRIIKPNGAIALFGSQPFTSALVMSNPKWFKYEWIWEKNTISGFLNAKKQPLRKHESILVFYQKQPSYNPQYEKYSQSTYDRANGSAFVIRHASKNSLQSCYIGHKEINGFTDFDRGRLPTTVQRFDTPKKQGFARLAPTQKPVKLIEYLIKTYTIEGELVLDNTAGSGTLAIAAINTNRRYICIEKDPDYFEVMRNRIENHDPNALAIPKKTRKPRAITEGQLALFC